MTGKNPFNRSEIPVVAVVAAMAGALFACSSPHRNVAVTSAGSDLAPIVDPRVELSSLEVGDGSVLRLTAELPSNGSAALAAPSGEFEGARVPFFPSSELGAQGVRIYEAFVPIPHNHKPGDAKVQVTAGEKSFDLPFRVVDSRYKSEVLKVDERHINPRRKDLIRIRREVSEVGEIYGRIDPEKRWSGPFQFPIKSRVTSGYGTKRVFNGELKSYHNGIDFKAAMGTPIHSAAAGRVVLAKNLFFTGWTVLVDHGYGIVTLYAHMSKLKVKKGQKVVAGQLLGLSGATGRVSGPHLHWATIVNRVKVNPLELMKLFR